MSFTDNGYELVNNFLSPAQLESFNSELGEVNLPHSSGGIRNAQSKFPCIEAYIKSDHVLDQAAAYLTGVPQFVRAILFNKTPENNWLVSLHQDKTVAVSKEFSEQDWGPWSKKDGVLHVQPPLKVLNAMVTFRIHLDSSTIENGCLSVVPGSHKLGVLNQQQISDRSSDIRSGHFRFDHFRSDHFKSVLCPAPAGSALIMRPHVLHSSNKGTVPTQRRVLHIEYSSYELPSGVFWAESV